LSYKHLFSRALAAAPRRLHFAAHSHHLWPDASWDGQAEAWNDAARLADHKWDRVMGPVWHEAQHHVADELKLPDPSTVVFAPSTHDLILRLFSAQSGKKPRVLSTTGEFHSFSRQAASWMLSGAIEWSQMAPELIAGAAATGQYDLIFASHIQFNNGIALPDLEALALTSDPDGPWIVLDGYHGFMATPTDLSAIANRVFYLAGGYKYAMAGEGVAFLHAPHGFGPEPAITGWFAEFDQLALSKRGLGYPADARRFLGSTFDPSGLYRFNAVQRMLKAEGLTTELISAHCAELKQRFVEACELPGFTLLNGPRYNFAADMHDEESKAAALRGLNPASQQRARFLAYMSDEDDYAARIQTELEKHGVIVDVRNDVLRIGFGLYQDFDDVDRLIAIFREIG
jgi:selenocysteine lyase/cysteine desulfurase